MADRPIIDARPEMVWCPAHGEHLRAQWPKGFIPLTMTLLEAALANNDLAREVDPQWAPPMARAHMNEQRLNAVLAVRPLCYWVSREVMRKGLMESGVGRLGKCDGCGRRGIGGPYLVSYPTGTRELWSCFECALDAGERLHRAHPNGNVWPRER